MRADSNNPIINNNYGQFLCTIGLYKQGLNYLEIAVEKYGDNTKVIALLNSGICAKTSGDIELAISFIDSALRISPNYSNAIIELSSLMIQKQDTNEQRHYYHVLIKYPNPRHFLSLHGLPNIQAERTVKRKQKA